MLKLIPLIIFPLSFFLIFLGVKNLTGDFSLNNQNFKDEIKKINLEAEKTESKIVTEKEQEPTVEEQNSFSLVENKINKEEKEKKIVKTENVKETVQKNNPLEKPEGIKSDSKKNEKVNSNIQIINENKGSSPLIIQFGAFSKKKNAEELKNSVIEKLNKKFPDFLINVDFDEKKKLYKLISKTNDIDKAKKVCSFSKEIKINCLFKKQ